MAESTAKLRSEILALSGVDIMENANEFKSTYKIMDELAAKWEDLSDIQQATITELIAGKRQGNIVSSLMTNFDTAREALDTSLNSAGSAMKEHEKWQQSLEAQINKLKASWQGLSQAFLKSDFLHGAIDVVIKFVDALTLLIDKVGVLPTLFVGFSVFKSFGNKGLFKTINNDLDGFINKIGIANKSFADLANAFNQGRTGKGIKGFISGLSAMKNSLSTTLTKADLSNIEAYNNLLDQGVGAQTAWYRTMQSSSDAAKDLVASANGGKVALNGMKTASIGAKAATIGLQIATTALNAALTMGISMLVSWAIEGVMKLVNAKKELAEQVEELTSKFQEQHEELKKLKGDYDTTNESSMISKYAKLSKGVDNLGRNVSLTADEYSEYQSIVNNIAEQIPSLVTGYDSQGNAILSVKGNVEELTKAYEKLIHLQNQEILSNNNDDIEKNWKNKLSQYQGYDFFESIGNFFGSIPHAFGVSDLKLFDMKEDTAEWFNSLTPDMSQEEIENSLVDFWNSRSFASTEIKQALQNAGYDIGYYDDSGKVSKILAEALEEEPEKIKGILDNYYAQFDESVAEYKTKASALLSEAFDVSPEISGLDYGGISEDLQAVAYRIVNSLDLDDLKELSEEGITIDDWVKNVLDQLNSIDADDSAKISAAFDLQTQFNGGEISYGEYVQGLENTGELINGLKLDKRIKNQLIFSIGLDKDGLVAEYQKLRNRLARDEYFNISEPEYESFIEGLSAEELSILWKVIPELEETEYKEDINDIKAALEKEMMLQGLTFDLNLEVEAAGLDALNTALAESVSATGLSSESINALKGRYADLESQGYDLSSMFEETSTGIRLNRQEFNKLEKAYATDKLAEVDGELEEMKKTYDDLGEAIKNTDDPVRKAELYNDRQTLAKRISEAATLAHQYKGLTNAYNDWLKAEEAGQERDMYENVIKGFETIDDEISRGWIDDGTIEFLELLTGRTDLAGKSGKQLKEIYNDLDKSIGNAGYSVRDFFTVNEDGESTNTGVYNFLETIESLGGKYKNAITKDANGNIIGFNFEVAGGDEAIAEALGVSEELVQIMVRAADDAGFVVSMDGTYRQLADLQNEAKAAADYLHQIGKTDFEFDFNTTSVENLKTQLEEAHKILKDKKFWNKDGTFNFNADGATQAMQVVSTLQAKLDKLTEDKYGIGLTVEDEEFEEPLENLQDYGRKVATLNQLELNPKANADEIEELKGELEDIAKYFAGLDGEKKVELGLDADDDWEEVKKKIENGEVKIPTVLDIQANMDKNIETLADLALLGSGLLSEQEEETIKKKYKVEVDAEEVDTTGIEDGVDNAIVDGLGNPILSREANIEIIAETFGIKDVDNLSTKLEGLDDKTIQAIAQAVGQGDVEALDLAIAGMDGNTVDAVCNALGYSDVETLKAAIANMKGNEVDAKVNTDGQAQKVWSLQSVIDGLKGTTVNIVLGITKAASSLWNWVTGNKGSTRNDSNGYSDVNGTANVNGTAGRAFARGNWRTKRTETALTGELGREIVVTPDNHWYTVGDAGAEFATIPKGSIVFNHRQTEELLKHGKVTSNGGRGKAFAEGTAFSRGIGGFGKVSSRISAVSADGDKEEIKTTTKSSKNKKITVKNTTEVNVGGSSGSGGSSSSSGGTGKVEGSAAGKDEKDKFEETFDWIAIAIERIEREIDNLDKTVNNVYKSWGDRNSALKDEITKVGKEITLQEDAADKYLTKANSVGLTEKDSTGKSYAELIQEGALNIEDFEGEKDEALVEKIKEYQKWYELYLDCIDAAEDLKQTEAELYEQRFDNVIAEYDGILQGFDHTESMLNEYISQAEARGHIVSKSYYQALIDNERQNIAALRQEQADLIAKRDEAVASGAIVKGSQAWLDMCAEIDSVTQAIEEGNTALIEYANSMRDIDWQVFDLIQERISDVAEEANFLIDLMSNDKLFDDNGKLTDKGMATMGLHGQNYNTYMYAADEYANEIADIDSKIANGELDGNSLDVINRRRELVKLQRESILAAEDEKQAIKDLVEEGINLELEALQERIDLHNEELESIKDLYDYQKQVKEQSEEIAALEKQRAAYLNDGSEESKAKLQEITVSLKEAKENLQETEFDRYISQQEQLLSSLYDEYELVLNERLDDLNGLITESFATVNDNATTINETIGGVAEGVGVELSEELTNIWSGENGIKGVVTEYYNGFNTSLTSVITTLGTIKDAVNTLAGKSDKEAEDKIEQPKTTTSATSNPTGGSGGGSNKPSSSSSSGGNKSSGDGKAKIGDKVKFLSGKYYYDSQGVNPAGSKNHGKQVYITNINKKSWATHPYHISTGKKLGQGDLGWLKLNQLSGYAAGKKNFLNDEIAWTQENGQELIIRPSDGAILTPIAKGDSVLTSAASRNIWNMANSPAEFIKDNLSLGAANVPNNSNVQSNLTQHFDKVIFNMPNVRNYEQLLSEMQKDKNFERLIMSMTIDQIAGKSSLAKGKSIR